MRKKIRHLLAFACCFLFAVPALAVQIDNPLGGEDLKGASDVVALVNQLIKFVLGFTGLLALLAFIYGGILWMSSFGDTKKISKGKEVMIWSVYGLVVIFASYAIVIALFQALGITSAQQ